MIASYPSNSDQHRARHRFLLNTLYRAGRDISIALLLMLAKVTGLMG